MIRRPLDHGRHDRALTPEERRRWGLDDALVRPAPVRYIDGAELAEISALEEARVRGELDKDPQIN